MLFEIIQNEIAYAKLRIGKRIQTLIKKVLASIATLFLSLFLLISGINFLLLSLFFYWSDLTNFVNPSLYCGILGIALGLIVLFFGISIAKSDY